MAGLSRSDNRVPPRAPPVTRNLGTRPAAQPDQTNRGDGDSAVATRHPHCPALPWTEVHGYSRRPLCGQNAPPAPYSASRREDGSIIFRPNPSSARPRAFCFPSAHPFATPLLFIRSYGPLHSPDYGSRYADNLGKELPRIPAVKRFADFQAFSKAGRGLAHWHLNYETVAPHAGVLLDTGRNVLKALTGDDYRVEKMKFSKTRDPETNKSVNDKTTVIYNARITIREIPLEAYEYVVNGKPALEWVMERQSVTTDKDSGIVNDANLRATETMGNPRYPLDL